MKNLKALAVVLMAALLLPCAVLPSSAEASPGHLYVNGVEGFQYLLLMANAADYEEFRELYDNMDSELINDDYYFSEYQAKYYAQAAVSILEKHVYPIPKGGELGWITVTEYHDEYADVYYRIEENLYVFHLSDMRYSVDGLEMIYENETENIKIYELVPVNYTAQYIIHIRGRSIRASFQQNNPDVPVEGGYELFDFTTLRALLGLPELPDPPEDDPGDDPLSGEPLIGDPPKEFPTGLVLGIALGVIPAGLIIFLFTVKKKRAPKA
ncbi:MAG: hypothetical protein FWE85_04615 [Clostridiales bacterium]|nr:hypothetical protein [Clostridiales bacterium]